MSGKWKWVEGGLRGHRVRMLIGAACLAVGLSIGFSMHRYSLTTPDYKVPLDSDFGEPRLVQADTVMLRGVVEKLIQVSGWPEKDSVNINLAVVRRPRFSVILWPN